MVNELAAIRKILDDHRIMLPHVRLAGDQVTCEESFIFLDRLCSEWTVGRVGGLPDKQRTLLQTLSMLAEGFRTHGALEEEVLRPILGELFMEGLIHEHQELTKEMGRLRSAVADSELEGLSREELMSYQTHILYLLLPLLEHIKEHASEEDGIFRMVERVLEKRESIRTSATG